MTTILQIAAGIILAEWISALTRVLVKRILGISK
jgi:hypothetical protein